MTRVLLIEDSPTQAEEAKMILEGDGFLVDLARDGAAGLERLAGAEYDLVISDVVMPGLSGYEVCRRIKADPAQQDVPVILLTSLRDPLEIVNALECGADNFINKDRSRETLVARIRGLLATRELRRARNLGATPGDRALAPVEVLFEGRPYSVTADREQILDLLLATYGDIVRTNRELEVSRAELAREHEALVRAQRLEKELGALLVHDIKSPAAGMMMLARSRLKKVDARSDEHRYWSAVLSSAEVINRMVLNLLDITRGEEHALAPRFSEVSTAEVLDEVRQLMVPLAGEREQELTVMVAPGLPLVRVDREMLRRVIQNLVDNALRYGPSKSVVSIRARARGGEVEISVADRGPGIPVELRERVFDKYVRLDNPRGQEASGGRGLGLAFCRIAMEALGGRIWIEDNLPEGTVFGLLLPSVTSR